MTSKGNLIAELRREAGFTQKTLADALHITDKAISKWERGLSLPDVSLLPKLSLLLGADLSLLLATSEKHPHEGWKGLIDLRQKSVDLWQRVYDKPLVYFLLSHFLLLNVTKINVLCSKENQKYLSQPEFSEFGFQFSFDFCGEADKNLMILNRPCFLFGSDLTHQFQGAMVSESVIKLVPDNMPAPFLFCPAEYVILYMKNPDYLYEIATPRTLGRGMICLDMDDVDSLMEIATFVQIYQKSSKLLIGSLEEIAYKRELLSRERMEKICSEVPYGKLLKNLIDNQTKLRCTKPQVG